MREAVERVLKVEKKENFNISIALVGRKAIKNLNRIYRRKNKATDVLSFGRNNKRKDPFENFGEVVICLDEVETNAKSVNVSFREELKRVLIHGTLHLLGYDHEQGAKAVNHMFLRQEYYL